MKDAVSLFLTRYKTLLPERDSDNWRPVEPGLYTHKSLPYGPMRDGITNGIVCYMATYERRVVYVHLSNLDVELDKADKPTAKKKPRQDDKQPPKRKKKFDPFDYI